MSDTKEETSIAEHGGAPASIEEVELAKLQAQLYGDDADDDGAGEDLGNGSAQGDAEDCADGSAAPISKSQMKKKARFERMLAKRAESRQREKAAKAQRRAEANQRKAAELAGMTEEQKEALKKEKQARLEALKDQERQLKERLKQSLESGPRVVIDLDWEDRMTENDMRHLVQQLSFSYAANKHVSRPAHMMLTSFKGGVAALANKMISGIDKWYVTRTDQHFSDVFSCAEDKAKLVYLTADAGDEVDQLDESKVYIIGGLVDHNRHKGLCEEQARAAGIATARLPISRHVQLSSRAVLTVNHVFQLLVEYYSCRDWATALDVVLPKRKRADYAKQQSEQPLQQQVQRQPQGQQRQQQIGQKQKQLQQGARKDERPRVGGGFDASASEEASTAEAAETEEGRGTKRKADGEPRPAE